jgi:NAD(P) transhydrogenase subunit alpha
VSAYDVRSASKEQVESVGAKFISVPEVSSEGAGGYAKELGADQQEKQYELLAEHAAKNDIIISTAQIPGKPAPKLITKEMVSRMRSGSVLVDLATATGGNIEGSKRDEVIKVSGATILGFSSLATHVPHDSSKLYAKNLYNFIIHAFKDGKLLINDEIVSSMIMTHGGKVV